MASHTRSKQRQVGSSLSFMAKRKPKRHPAAASDSREQMTQTGTHHVCLPAVLGLVVAVCAAPLTAEVSSSGFPHHKHQVLRMDEASLTVYNELDSEVLVSWMSERCYQCLYQQLGVVPAGSSPGQPGSVDFVVGTQHAGYAQDQQRSGALHVSYRTEHQENMFPFHFGEHGNYSLWVKSDSKVVNCSMVTQADPVNSYIPILVAFLVFAGLALVSAIGKTILRLDAVRALLFRVAGTMETERLINSELGSPGRTGTPVTDNILPPPPSPSKRLRSLDTFRGISFGHHGVCELRRRAILVLQTRELERPYCCRSSLPLVRVHHGHIDCPVHQLPAPRGQHPLFAAEESRVEERAALHHRRLHHQPKLLPGTMGYLGPGGIGDMGLYANCTGGAAGFLDRWLLGESHIYQTPSSRVIYATRMPYDPEGVLGSINSILMAFLGLQAGKIILHYRDLHRSIMSRFLIWGLFLGVISAVLTKCSTDQGFIPVNKNLWSLSYVTTLACFAYVLLVLVYYTVDVKRWWSGAPFYYPGMNSILVYVGHEVFEEYFPFRWRMANSQSHAEHLTQNLVATSCWVLISYVLYRKKIFWKI
ncbi:Heparan-alpha-glucosaminide N-acetyltransferase [Larimichthys crocea]|uniref:Uncharacterized protein n=1 Tax=Larimichthys crocea TaxID=215358 RepID=A0ACD3RVJ3_LARCR|nr:Heparan-alpha-glucosaminide N-acetyltransferase [Larimichthys crocea]